jgi:hypothetical protein
VVILTTVSLIYAHCRGALLFVFAVVGAGSELGEDEEAALAGLAEGRVAGRAVYAT